MDAGVGVVTAPGSFVEPYARWRASTLGAITERVESRVVFDLAGPLRGGRVLDVGTGHGTYAIEAAQRGAQVTGVDADPAMLGAARERARAAGVAVTLREARAEKLPFDDGAFDLVVGVTVLCFVRDARAAVREMARVLSPGGRLVLGELGRFSVWAVTRRVRGFFGSAMWKDARFWAPRELTALARHAGLRVVDTRGAVFYPPSNVAAKLGGPLDPVLSWLRAPGAAFLAMAADKPGLRP
jgi:SAM-dependent methyltransferase